MAAGADDASAWTTSRLEFARHPDLMAQFPFAHTLTMTHRLAGGELEVETAHRESRRRTDARGRRLPPLLPTSGRAARSVDTSTWRRATHLLLDEMLIPTGERRPLEFADPYPLTGAVLDDVFAQPGARPRRPRAFLGGRRRRRITVTYGPKYTVAVVYAPAGKDFICFEPMSAITNAFNLAHAGIYKELQSVPPGETWRESFWVGFRAPSDYPPFTASRPSMCARRRARYEPPGPRVARRRHAHRSTSPSNR